MNEGRVHIRLPEGLKRWARSYAKSQGLSVSDLIRKYLEDAQRKSLFVEEVKVHVIE